MAQIYDTARLRRMITINTVVQGLLIVLLLLSALKFQQGLQAQGRGFRFLHSVYLTIAIQLLIFYPLRKLAMKDVEREVKTSQSGLSKEKQQELRRERIFSDFLKGAIFIFFVTFIARAPGDLFVLASIFFTFVLTTLSYFQCFNFAAKRRIREIS